MFCRPGQSLYVWARLPQVDSANVFTRQCLAHGVVLARGAIFSVDRQVVQPWTRLNVAYLADPTFRKCMKAAADGTLAGEQMR